MVPAAVNLFPYTMLWRIGNEPYHSHKCSVIVTVIIVLIIVVVLVERLITWI